MQGLPVRTMRTKAPFRRPISANRVTVSAHPSTSAIRPVSPACRQSKGTMSTRAPLGKSLVETESQLLVILPGSAHMSNLIECRSLDFHKSHPSYKSYYFHGTYGTNGTYRTDGKSSELQMKESD